MRTEWYVGQEYDAQGERLGNVDMQLIKARKVIARWFGGFTELNALGGEQGKPPEQTAVFISDVPEQVQALDMAEYLRELFNQRSVFGFFGNEAFLIEKGEA